MCCMWPYKATVSIVSVRSQGDEVRVSESDNSRHWCGISMIPTPPTDASGDADSEPGATVKSLIKSFDTVGQSEHRAPRQQHTLRLAHTVNPNTTVGPQRTDGEVSARICLGSYVQLCQQVGGFFCVTIESFYISEYEGCVGGQRTGKCSQQPQHLFWR